MAAARLTLAVLFSAALALNAAWAEPSIYPTGVTRCDPAKAYGTFILFSGGDNKTHLIDMDGREVPRSEERRVGKECRSRWSPYH